MKPWPTRESVRFALGERFPGLRERDSELCEHSPASRGHFPHSPRVLYRLGGDAYPFAGGIPPLGGRPFPVRRRISPATPVVRRARRSRRSVRWDFALTARMLCRGFREGGHQEDRGHLTKTPRPRPGTRRWVLRWAACRLLLKAIYRHRAIIVHITYHGAVLLAAAIMAGAVAAPSLKFRCIGRP